MLNQNNRIKVEIIDQIAHVELARPNKHNALDMRMFESIVKTTKTLKKNRSISAVILSGEGSDFCTGLDVKSVIKLAKGPLKLLLKLNPWSSNLAQKVSTSWQNIVVPVIAGLVTYVDDDSFAKSQELAEEICQQSPDSVAGDFINITQTIIF